MASLVTSLVGNMLNDASVSAPHTPVGKLGGKIDVHDTPTCEALDDYSSSGGDEWEEEDGPPATRPLSPTSSSDSGGECDVAGLPGTDENRRDNRCASPQRHVANVDWLGRSTQKAVTMPDRATTGFIGGMMSNIAARLRVGRESDGGEKGQGAPAETVPPAKNNRIIHITGDTSRLSGQRSGNRATSSSNDVARPRTAEERRPIDDGQRRPGTAGSSRMGRSYGQSRPQEVKHESAEGATRPIQNFSCPVRMNLESPLMSKQEVPLRMEPSAAQLRTHQSWAHFQPLDAPNQLNATKPQTPPPGASDSAASDPATKAKTNPRAARVQRTAVPPTASVATTSSAMKAYGDASEMRNALMAEVTENIDTAAAEEFCVPPR